MISGQQDRRRLIFFNKRYSPHHRRQFVQSRLRYRLIKVLREISKGGDVK
jgi:hypothetical protein